MILTILIMLLAINIIGFFNRKKVWAKVFMLSQVFIVGGMVIMFNIQKSQTGIPGLEAKDKNIQENTNDVDKLKNVVKGKEDQQDTMEMEKENQDKNKVLFH